MLHEGRCVILARLRLTRTREITSGESCDVIATVGPTAAGKTAVAIELVESIGGEIVSADSMAVYLGMDVGTAKPTDDERSRARFHLIDVADPGNHYDRRFRRFFS